MSISALHDIFMANPAISTDTRKDLTGTIFFCIKGPNFDANSFAEIALNKGAAYVVSDDKSHLKKERILVVDDALKCLQELATFHREQFDFPVIGLTGSNGKTTNKELIHAVLSTKYSSFATKGNFNNHIGVPLTLLSIPLDADMAIIEMGANHQGEIKALCEICKPDFGLITNIGKAHLEGFGGVEGVIKGKKELYDFIGNNDGELFVNVDDELLMKLSTPISRTLFGTKVDGLIKGELLKKEGMISFQFSSQGKTSGEIQTKLVGDYNFTNFLAAACIGIRFKVRIEDIVLALSSYTPDNNRSQLTDTGKNKVILDAYNANPSSVHAALINFAQSPEKEKCVLLGQMMELGETSKMEHQEVINLLDELGLDSMLVGDYFKECDTLDFPVYSNVISLNEALQSSPLLGKLILVKGSRSVTMEKVLSTL